MKTADEFLQEVENKPVYYYVYGYFDENVKVFHQPFFAKEEPEFMLQQLKGSILKGQVDVKNLIDMNLVLFGKFDLTSGKFEIGSFDDYQVICECNRFIKKPENGAIA